MSQPDRVRRYRPLRDLLLGGLPVFAVAAAVGGLVISVVEGDWRAGGVWVGAIAIFAALSFVMRTLVFAFCAVLLTPILAVVVMIAPSLKRRQARRDAERWLKRKPPYEPT